MRLTRRFITQTLRLVLISDNWITPLARDFECYGLTSQGTYQQLVS